MDDFQSPDNAHTKVGSEKEYEMNHGIHANSLHLAQSMLTMFVDKSQYLGRNVSRTPKNIYVIIISRERLMISATKR